MCSQRGRLTSPVLFSGPHDSSASLPISVPAACAVGSVAANPARALVAASLVAEGKSAGETCPAPRRLRGWDGEGGFHWSMWRIVGGCLEALPVTLEMGWGRNLGGRSGDLRGPDSKPPVWIPLSCPRHPPVPLHSSWFRLFPAGT